MDNNETVARELRDNSDAAVEASGGYQSKEISPSVKRMLDAQKQKNSDAARKTWPQIKLKVRDGNGLEALVDLEMIRSEAVEAMGIHQEEMRLVSPGATILVTVFVNGKPVWQNPNEPEIET